MLDGQKYPLSDDSPFSLFLIAPQDESILWANQATQEWLGKSTKSLAGKTIWNFLDVSDLARSIVSKSHESGHPVTMRDVGVTREDEIVFYHVTAFPTIGNIALTLQRSGRQPYAGGLGGRLVSGMGRMIAHELKNPLAGIKGAAQLLRDDVDTDEGQDLLDLISSEIDRIRRLADRMETLGDTDPENNDHVNIHELLRQARRIIQSANPNLVFTEQYDPSLPPAIGDSDTLMQALLNLIKNASEAIESNVKSPEIILETRFRTGIRSGDANGSHSLPIEIRIIDNGPGVEPDLLNQLFQPFVTNKPEGQGLGLALVSKVASAHGGVVEVSSQPGRTKFSLLLPVS